MAQKRPFERRENTLAKDVTHAHFPAVTHAGLNAPPTPAKSYDFSRSIFCDFLPANKKHARCAGKMALQLFCLEHARVVSTIS